MLYIQVPCLCHTCYVAGRGEVVYLEGVGTVPKPSFVKKKNEETSEEPWVACDGCDNWIHQICGLFNKGRNKDEPPYLCPHCLLDGLRGETRKPASERPQSMLQVRGEERRGGERRGEERR